jgi:integrase
MTSSYGSGTLTQLSPNKWRLRVYIGRDPRTGAPSQRSRRYTGTETGARRALARMVTEAQDGRYNRSAATLGQLIDEWITAIEPTRSPKTIHEYRAKVRNHIAPTLGRVRLDQLTAQKLDRQYAAWLRSDLSQSTVHHLATLIKAACNQGVKWGWMTSNPAAQSSPPTQRSVPPNVPSPDQLLALLDAALLIDDRGTLATAIALAAVTGARRGELCALRWSDIDFVAGTVTIARSISDVRGELITGPTKTHAERTVMLGEAGVGTLSRRRVQIERIADEVGVPLDPDPYLISDLSETPRSDEPLPPDMLTKRFIRLGKSIDLKFRFHDLRHFAATQLVGAGVDVRTVANRLGHADPAMTLRVYAQPLSERDAHAADVLGQIVAPALSPTDDERLTATDEVGTEYDITLRPA